MADEKIQVEISGKYDSKAADEAIADAKEIEKLDPELTVTADTDQAAADLKALQDRADRALIIQAQIDQAEGELKKLKSDLDAVDDAATTTGRKIGDEMEAGTSKAKDATHSLAGAAIGDTLGAATGFGALGESVSQVTEGILAGEVGMKDLLSAGLAMGAITLVVQTITTALAETKAVDAFNKKKVEDFTKALREGKTVIDSINDAFRETGKIEFADQVSGKTRDLVGDLADAGVTFDEFLSKVALGKDGFKAWVIELGKGVDPLQDMNGLIQAGNQFIDDRTAAEKAWADQMFVNGTTAAETERELHRLNNTYDTGTDSIDHNTDATKTATGQMGRFREQTALADGAYRRLTGVLDEQEGWANVNQAITDYNKNTKTSDEDTRNLILTVADYVDATDTIPESKKTEVFAVLNSGDVAAIEKTMDELTRQRDLKILLTAVGSKDTIKALKIGGIGAGIVVEGTSQVTVNMPRGVRQSDIQKAIGYSTRRNGKRFGVRT